MSKPGVIQRVGFEIHIMKHRTDPKCLVNLQVAVEGVCDDRGDALLMIVDAWCQAMTDEGFDPDASFLRMRKHGTLQ